MRAACKEGVVGSMELGIEWLKRAATAGHQVAAYVLGVLHYGDKEAERYIRQVEDEDEAGGHGCKASRAAKVARAVVVAWRKDGQAAPPFVATDVGLAITC